MSELHNVHTTVQQDEAARTLRTLTTAKNELTRAVTDAILQFHSRTGVCPSEVRVEMVRITMTGSIHEFAVGDIVVAFEV